MPSILVMCMRGEGSNGDVNGIGRFYAGYEPLERIKGIDSFDSLLGRTLENQKEATAKRNDDDRRDDRHILRCLSFLRPLPSPRYPPATYRCCYLS